MQLRKRANDLLEAIQNIPNTIEYMSHYYKEDLFKQEMKDNKNSESLEQKENIFTIYEQDLAIQEMRFSR